MSILVIKPLVMKKIYLLTVLALLSIDAFSQKDFHSKNAGSPGSANSNYDLYLRTIDVDQKAMSFGLTEAEFNKVKDEAYSNPNFILGKIFQDDQLLRSDVPMRYNAYADEIEIKNSLEGASTGALIKDPNIFVKIGPEIYVFIPYEESIEKGGYFSVLAEGKRYSLYKKTTAVFLESKKASTSFAQDTPPSFPKATTYYLVDKGRFLEMPNSKRRIMRMMDSKKAKMISYIKQNNLDIDKEADLVKAITYFDSLL